MRGIRVWARLLGLHRAGDAPVEQDCLLDRRIIEGDESERPRCHECAEAPVRLEFADQLRLAVDLRERTVIGAVGVSDGVLGTVTRSIERYLPRAWRFGRNGLVSQCRRKMT